MFFEVFLEEEECPVLVVSDVVIVAFAFDVVPSQSK
jgi:hypothetical protein